MAKNGNCSYSEKDSNDNTENPTQKKRRRHRLNPGDEGYNSEDEYVRPRVNPNQIDEQRLKFVNAKDLAERLATKGLRIVKMPEDGNCLYQSVGEREAPLFTICNGRIRKLY